jgi:ABC-2 type transport system permease protein
MISLIKRDVLTLVRDKSNIFFICVFPALMVFLFGTIMQNISASDRPIEKITIEYSVETADHFSEAAIGQFIAALGGTDNIEVTETLDLEASKRKAGEGSISAAVLFTEPFGMEIYEGRDEIQNSAVESVFHGFSRRLTALRKLYEYSPEKLNAAAEESAAGLVRQKESGYNRTMMDYYAVSIIVMMVFMIGGMTGASAVRDGRLDGTLRRVLVSPKNRVTIYIQSVVGNLPMSLIQVVFVMIPSVALFNARYAETAAGNALLFFTMVMVSMAVNSASMIIGLLVSVNPTIILMPFFQVIMFISGTFTKEIHIEGVSNFMPPWIIQNAAFDLTVFGRGGKCVEVIIVSAAVLIAATCIGAALFKRKELMFK